VLQDWAAARVGVPPILVQLQIVPILTVLLTADAALAAKLQEELSFEKDSQAAMAGQEPEWLEEFKSNGVWNVTDKVGNGEVVLSRTFGNEK